MESRQNKKIKIKHINGILDSAVSGSYQQKTSLGVKLIEQSKHLCTTKHLAPAQQPTNNHIKPDLQGQPYLILTF